MVSIIPHLQRLTVAVHDMLCLDQCSLLRTVCEGSTNGVCASGWLLYNLKCSHAFFSSHLKRRALKEWFAVWFCECLAESPLSEVYSSQIEAWHLQGLVKRWALCLHGLGSNEELIHRTDEKEKRKTASAYFLPGSRLVLCVPPLISGLTFIASYSSRAKLIIFR